MILKRRADCKHIHEELRRNGVTLMLLLEEYVEEQIALDESYLKYMQFCNVYKSYVDTNKKKLKYYSRVDLLIIDEWLLNLTTAQ